MKCNKENLITVAFLELDNLDLEAYSKTLSEEFLYYEILLIVNDLQLSETEGAKILSNHSNVRLIRLNGRYSQDVIETVILEESIGDVVVMLPSSVGPENVSQLVNKVLSGDDYVVIRYAKESTYSFYSFFNWFYCLLLYIITGIKIPSGLSNCVAVSRNLIGAINHSNVPHRYLKLMNVQLGKGIVCLDGDVKRPSVSLAYLAERISFGVDVLSNASPRLIKFTAVLALGVSMVNALYLVYVVMAYMLLDVERGWTTMSLMMSAMFCVLFFVLSIVAATTKNIMYQNKQYPSYGIKKEESSSDLINKIAKSNVEF